MFRSIRFRLTVWYVVLLAVILGAFSAGIYFALRQDLYDNLRKSLDSRAELLLGHISYEGGRPLLTEAEAPPDPEEEHFARVFDASGNVTFDNSTEEIEVPVDEAAVRAALDGETTRKTQDAEEEPMQVLTRPITDGSRITGALQVGLTEEDTRDTLTTLLLIIAIAYPLTLIVASAGGAFLAGRALSPIDKLTGVARRIRAEDLHQRIDLDLPDDEVGRLARTFNEMIAGLDESFQRQRQFTADASHELRTPLTAIKGQTEVALQRARTPEEYREVLGIVNREADRMIRMVASLLTLARADAGQIPVAREPVDVGRLVSDAAEQVRAAAEARGLTLRVEAGQAATAEGDRDLLLQLVLNLLDNAVKYSTPGGTITAGCSAAEGAVSVRVSDSGPGIAPEHLPRIFDRFYRADSARSHAEGSAGLGLSICRWIAEAHGGSIEVDSSPAGSTFTVRLPATR
jgi:heavy metal sensor kinase